MLPVSFQDADGLKLAIDSMQDCLKDVDVDVIVGTESRGFIFGMPIAYNLHKSLYQYVRKENSHVRPFLQAMIWNMAKLRLRFIKDAIKPGQKVVIIDDLIATGGTLKLQRSSWWNNLAVRLSRLYFSWNLQV